MLAVVQKVVIVKPLDVLDSVVELGADALLAGARDAAAEGARAGVDAAEGVAVVGPHFVEEGFEEDAARDTAGENKFFIKQLLGNCALN